MCNVFVSSRGVFSVRMFFSSAYGAQPNMGSANMLMTFIPFVLIFVVFYFISIRPQMKRTNELQKLIKSIVKGDTVLTNSGIFGTVSKVKDDVFILEIAEDVNITIKRNCIVDKIINKGIVSLEGKEENKAPTDEKKGNNKGKNVVARKGKKG